VPLSPRHILNCRFESFVLPGGVTVLLLLLILLPPPRRSPSAGIVLIFLTEAMPKAPLSSSSSSSWSKFTTDARDIIELWWTEDPLFTTLLKILWRIFEACSAIETRPF